MLKPSDAAFIERMRKIIPDLKIVSSDAPNVRSFKKALAIIDRQNRAIEKQEKALDIFTCARCEERETCKYAWDHYNTNGDCLAYK